MGAPAAREEPLKTWWETGMGVAMIREPSEDNFEFFDIEIYLFVI